MRYLRLFSVLILSTFAVTGCHRKREQVVPSPQAQAPIVSTLPPVPPLNFPDVQLAKPKPATPVVHPPPPAKKKKPRIETIHRHHTVHKATPDTVAAATTSPAQPPAEAASATPTPTPTKGAAVLGQLSTDDAVVNPHQNVQTKRLIDHTEARLKRVSYAEKSEHKDAIAQVSSFLDQAKQAWAMNDVVGAETLANKAKILLDELLK